MARTHPLDHLETILSVATGGFVGATLRYLLEVLLVSTLVATLAANVLGCAALGFLLYEDLYSGRISESGRLLLATGFLASFTTYSTFVIDAIQARPVVAVGYVAGSYALGFGAVLVGRDGARRVAATDRPFEEVRE